MTFEFTLAKESFQHSVSEEFNRKNLHAYKKSDATQLTLNLNAGL